MAIVRTGSNLVGMDMGISGAKLPYLLNEKIIKELSFAFKD
jgi:hypothetical protein